MNLPIDFQLNGEDFPGVVARQAMIVNNALAQMIFFLSLTVKLGICRALLESHFLDSASNSFFSFCLAPLPLALDRTNLCTHPHKVMKVPISKDIIVDTKYSSSKVRTWKFKYQHTRQITSYHTIGGKIYESTNCFEGNLDMHIKYSHIKCSSKVPSRRLWT